MLEGIIIKSAIQLNAERSVANIFYLLTGKHSITTIQDANIYGIENFLGIYKDLNRSDFDEIIAKLIQNEFFIENRNENNQLFLQPTALATSWLDENERNLPIHYFNGIRFNKRASLFYARLLLLIQTLTNVRENNFSFIPVISDINVEQWVKRAFTRLKGAELNYLKELNKEFLTIFNEFPTDYIHIFLDRLTGYKHYGKSIGQLAKDYDQKTYDIELIIIGIVHEIIKHTEANKDSFPAFRFILQDTQEDLKLLESTKKTYFLYKKNFQPDEIAHIRQLKINTIYDHLAEIALLDIEFPFHQFVPVSEQEEIIKAIEKTNSFKLKDIKELVKPSISYFQIRLMLILHKRLEQKDARNIT
ncbi:YpbB family protein [Oceanobacillus sp. CAU 1775]